MLTLLPAGAILVAMPPASATASSGWYKEATVGEPGTNVNFCVEAVIADTAQNRAYSLTDYYNYACSTSAHQWNAPPGYLGAYAEGFLNGSFCGDTGWYYNASTTYEFGVGANECGNDGCHPYYTVAFGELWFPAEDSYYESPYVASPDQNYYC